MKRRATKAIPLPLAGGPRGGRGEATDVDFLPPTPSRKREGEFLALLAVLALVVSAAHVQAQSIDSVVTATADARDIAVLGERTLVATEGGLAVLHHGSLERVIGPGEGLPGARARSVSITDEGAWVGAVEGTVLLAPDDLRPVRTLPLRRVRRAVRFAGQTWLASFGDGLHRFDGELHHVSLGDAHAYVRLTDVIVHEDELWVATSGVGILRVGPDGRVRGRIRSRDGLPADYVWRLVPHESHVLALTIDGVAVLDASGNVLRDSPITSSARRLPVRDVRALAMHDGELWLGTFARGLFRARPGDRPRAVRGPVTEIHAIASREQSLLVAHSGGVHRAGDRLDPVLAGGLPSGDVTALARAFGTIWAGTFDHGLARMRNGTFEPVTEAHGRWAVDRRINDLAASRDRLWIATDRGLYWHDGRIFSRVEDPRGPGQVHTTALHLDRTGALWVASTRQLCRYQRDAWQCWTGGPELPIAQLHAVTTDARGRVWVGSLHGLYRFHDGRFERHTVSSGALPVDWVTALVPWGDGVMAGTYHGGLALYEGERFRIVRESDGLPSGWVNPHAIRRVGDEAWIGTLERGLVAGRPGAWRHLTRADGLPSDDVTDVLEDRDAIWIATRGGLARIAR
jgi:ligand-binding sensor domain-containing protein